MIRPISPDDSTALVALMTRSGLLNLDELVSFQEMLHAHHAGGSNGGQIFTYVEGGIPVGIAYFVPKEFADRVWELLVIAVDATLQRTGIGGQLLQAVEVAARTASGRLLLIETSSKASFERTRQFYRKHGYAEVAHIPDYYSDGDGKASFVKRLAGC